MHGDSNRPRPRGTGSLLRRTDSSGADTWYGKWSADGRQVMRRLGAVRVPRVRGGLTRTQAEAALRSAIETSNGTRARPDQLTVAEAAARYLENRRAVGLKRGTLSDYESYLRVHVLPVFGAQPLDEVSVDDIDDFMMLTLRNGSARKSVLKYLAVLHAVFGYGVKRGWCTSNPVASVDKPRNVHEPEIRYLDQGELEALLAATPDTALGALERVLYLTAAMTGMRRGELLALRWQDVDWDAGVIRVRRTYTRGEFGTPKTRRSSRAVPLVERVRRELLAHQARQGSERRCELVFAHPVTGRVLDPSKMRTRFKAAAARADLRPVRFHDLRHTFGTRMAAAGAPLRAVQEWLGHSDYRTTSIYADYAPDMSQAAVWARRAFPDAEGEA